MSNDIRAVLDIGSNTIRLLIAEITTKKTFNKIHYQHSIARLGQGLQQTGQICEDGKNRALLVFHEVVDVCKRCGVQAEEITAVATAAVREASNGQAFVAEVFQATGLRIQIISGEIEAKLALQGAMLGLSEEIGSDMLLFDIGGGSTEFTRVSHGKLKSTISTKMGVVRLTESYLKSNPVSVSDYADAKSAALNFLKEVESSWGHDARLPKYLVGTAGTVTTLAAIAQNMAIYDAFKIDGYVILYQDFQTLRDDLLRKTHDQRLAVPGLEKGREDVIVAGLAIIDVMFSRWGHDALIAVDSGLLVGLLTFSGELQ